VEVEAVTWSTMVVAVVMVMVVVVVGGVGGGVVGRSCSCGGSSVREDSSECSVVQCMLVAS
jgi:hypothetical protein